MITGRNASRLGHLTACPPHSSFGGSCRLFASFLCMKLQQLDNGASSMHAASPRNQSGLSIVVSVACSLCHSPPRRAWSPAALLLECPIVPSRPGWLRLSLLILSRATKHTVSPRAQPAWRRAFQSASQFQAKGTFERFRPSSIGLVH